ncbi:MAG: TonB-dependent receptor plug domain-containing protein, partial [Paraglaciecola sp.]
MRTTNKYFSPSLISASIAAIFVASPVFSQESDTSQTADAEEKIQVVGRRISETEIAIGTGEVTNTLAVTREALLSAPAGISGLKMLESLPGFNVQTDGALGLYEFGNSVNVRAFNLSQIGFVLNGVPMGRSDAFGGSPIFRYVDNENLASVVASPGAGDVSAPSYSSLGPIASYYSVAPSDEMGGLVSMTIGDDNLQRSFVKLETGDINGFKAYISRSKTDSDLWRGPGTIDREHIEGKAIYTFDQGTTLEFSYVANDFFDYDSPSSFA